MENSMSRLLVGLSVQVGRSDGRVHPAIVKSVDIDKSTAFLEWNESKICRGKEVELKELCTLNPELLELVDSIINRVASPPPLAPAEKKYGSRLRSSRIPAPASSSAPAVSQAEDTVSRPQTRLTCLFRATAPVPAAPSTQANADDISPTSVLKNSNAPYQQHKRNEAKMVSNLHSLHEAIKENDVPERLAPLPAATGRRKSVVSDYNKGNKRQSSAVKPSEMQTKRGKFGEVSRPNQKFYEMIQDFRETLEIAPMTTADQSDSHRICVCVRKRPFNKQELNKKEIDVISVPGNGSLLVHEPKQKVDLTKFLDNHAFQFDYSFDESATNDLVYKFTAKPLVQSIFEGSMATCFAYGQTGSGKTFTMGGEFAGKQQNSAKGIYGLAAQDVFTLINHRRYAHLDISPYISFFEIYNGKVYDLLNKKAKLRVLEDDKQQVQVVGLEEVNVSSAEDVIKMIQLGNGHRTSGQTSANANSSRSHAVLQIVLRYNDRNGTMHGKFSLVDLAGNERGTDVSSNDRGTLVETAEINRSLLALKECIRSLGMNSDHIPFRMSTLTKVLRDSFIGEKSKTCMIAMVSPGMSSCEYTMNTLRYADRVKELKGPSKGSEAAKAREPIDTSGSEESDNERSVYDAVSEVVKQAEHVYTELQRGNELSEQMEHTSFNIETGLPDLKAHAQKLMDTILALEKAVAQEQAVRRNH